MISSTDQHDKIPSSLQLRFTELIRALDFNGQSVLELSNEPDGIGQILSETRFRSAGISHVWNIDEAYDIIVLYSAICHFPVNCIDGVLERILTSIRHKLVIVEDLPVDVFSEKELEIRKMIMPEHPGYLNGIVETKLNDTGFKRIVRKIWSSQIPISEDEVARKIRILSRMAVERRIDIGEELQDLFTIYRIHRPIFTYKELITAYKY